MTEESVKPTKATIVQSHPGKANVKGRGVVQVEKGKQTCLQTSLQQGQGHWKQRSLV